MSEPARVEIHAISKHHDLSAFDCGEPALDEYLRQYARQNHERGIGKTFVALAPVGDHGVIGFYTVVVSEIDAEELPSSHKKHMPRYPVPVIRLGRLAVDKRHQHTRIGEALLLDALRRGAVLSEEVGIYAVVVDIKNERSRRFYGKYGFIPLTNNPRTMFLPLKTIRKAFR